AGEDATGRTAGSRMRPAAGRHTPSDLRRKGVAATHVSALKTALEPLNTLGRGSMGKAVRHHLTAASSLQTVVPDGRGSLQCFLQITRLEHVAVAVGRMPPDPGETVGLQLLAYRQAVDHRCRFTLSGAAHLLSDTEDGLDMMSYLVGHHIGVGKVPRRTELAIQITEEAQVQIHLAIGRAIEGADRRAGAATGGSNPPAEHDQHR